MSPCDQMTLVISDYFELIFGINSFVGFLKSKTFGNLTLIVVSYKMPKNVLLNREISSSKKGKKLK